MIIMFIILILLLVLATIDFFVFSREDKKEEFSEDIINKQWE